MNNRLQGAVCALICVALWAFIPVVSRLGQLSLDHHQFLFWSSVFSFLMVLLLCCVTGSINSLRDYSVKDWWQAGLLGFLGTYLYFLLLYKGYGSGKGMEVLIVQYTWPIFIALLSAVFLKEIFDRRKRAALVLGFTAIILVFTKGELSQFSLDQPELLLWVAGGALCFAVFSVFSKGIRLEPNGLMLVFFAVATVASFVSMQVLSTFELSDRNSLIIVMISGVLVNGLSDVLWLWSLRKTEASFLAPFVFIAPVLSTLYMQVFFDEPFLPVYGVGLTLIVLAGLINTVKISPKASKYALNRLGEMMVWKRKNG